MPPQTSEPGRWDPLAVEILEELRTSPAAREIVLGGYFALRHYMDYRTTHDLDAWWHSGRTEPAVQLIRRAMEAVAKRRALQVRQREWGETASFELLRQGKTIFTFQIAVRTVELEPPTESQWPPILLESLRDNLGSKMNALVYRGAARDFLDIREAVRRGLLTVEDCWELWARKNPQGDRHSARAMVLKHLEALEMRRPLDEIPDAEERAAASQAREWLRDAFLGPSAAQED